MESRQRLNGLSNFEEEFSEDKTCTKNTEKSEL